MGKVGGATPAKKKKGRPSLVDLKKRALEQQELQNHLQAHRRSTRRNPNSSATADDASIDEDDYYEDEDDDERKEKKVKLVVRLPPLNQQGHLVRSSSVNSASCGSDSNADADNRKINSGSGGILTHHQEEKVPKAMDTPHGSPLETGPTTPLPDKKLLVFILDRLQKKDTHAVFSEPVDPDELPDYHEVIEQPMDFGTVRSKLDKGLYSNLEELEADVYLICSNAMQYNSSDTVFFRQARSIQELAKRDFENLRQEGDDGELQPKVVKRGRPPSKHLKKPPGRTPLDIVGTPESTSGATVANAVDNTNDSTPYNLRRGPMVYKNYADSLLPSHRSRNGEQHSELLSDWNEEFPAMANIIERFDRLITAIDSLRATMEKQHAEVVNLLLERTRASRPPPPSHTTQPLPQFTYPPSQPLLPYHPPSQPPSFNQPSQPSTTQPNPTPSPPINPPSQPPSPVNKLQQPTPTLIPTTQPPQSFVLPSLSPPLTFKPNQPLPISHPPTIFGFDNGQSSRLREDAWREDLVGQLRRTLYRPKDTSRRGLLDKDCYIWDPGITLARIKRADMKYGNKHFNIDETRRDTYKQFHPLNHAHRHSLLTNFGGERKQLLAVGLHAEHGYSRSLARFAANMGPVVWKIASKQIEKALPPGVTFSPGVVGEPEPSPPPTSLFPPGSQNYTPRLPSTDILNKPETPSTSGPKNEDSEVTINKLIPHNGKNGFNSTSGSNHSKTGTFQAHGHQPADSATDEAQGTKGETGNPGKPSWQQCNGG